MHLLQIPGRVFFQPDAFEESLRRDPIFRKHTRRSHVVLAVVWVVVCAGTAALLRRTHDWFTNPYQMVLVVGAILTISLMIALTVGALRQRDYVFSWIAGVYIGILASIAFIILERVGSTALGLVSLPIITGSFLIATVVGQTRGIVHATVLCAAVSAVITLVATDNRYDNPTILPRVDRVEHTLGGEIVIVAVSLREGLEFEQGLPSFVRVGQNVRVVLDSALQPRSFQFDDTILIPHTLSVTEDTTTVFSVPDSYPGGIDAIASSADTAARPTDNQRIRTEALLALPQLGEEKDIRPYLARNGEFIDGINRWRFEPAYRSETARLTGDSVLGINVSHISGSSGEIRCRFRLPPESLLHPILVGEDLFVPTNRRFWLLRCGKPTHEYGRLKWYELAGDTFASYPNYRTRSSPSSVAYWGDDYMGVPLRTAIADGDHVYAVSPSRQLFGVDRKSHRVLFRDDSFQRERATAKRLAVATFFTFYTVILLTAVVCGLYRIPFYLLEAVFQCGIWLYLFTAHATNRASVPGSRRVPAIALYAPVLGDHVSTLPFPASRGVLTHLGRIDPAAFSRLLNQMLRTSKQDRLMASEFIRFHSENRDYLLGAIGEQLKQEEPSVFGRVLAHLSPQARSSLIPRALLSSKRLFEIPGDREGLVVQIEVMRELAESGYANAEELQHSCAAFLAFLRYSSLESLHDAERQVESLLRIGYHERLNPALIEFLEMLLEVARDIGNYSIVEKFRDRQYYLSEARIKLYEASRSAKELLYEPYRTIALQVVEHWQSLITREARSVRGPAELQLSLVSRSLNGDHAWSPVVVNVRNTGQSPAENVRISVVNNEHLLVNAAETVLPVLGIGENRDVEFQVRSKRRDGQKLRLYLDAVFDDFERAGKVVPFADVLQISQEGEEFRRVPNPYIVGQPIQNDQLFFGRTAALDFAVQNLMSGAQNNALIFFGQRRVGKSSLLYRLVKSELNEQFVFVYIDCQGFADAQTPQVLYMICRKIQQAAQARSVPVPEPDLERFQAHSFLELDRYLEAAEQVLGRMRLALMFDEYEYLEYKARNGSLSAEIFNKLRSLMQHHNTRLAFIFAGTHRLTELTQDYWSFLFNTALYYEIGPLARESAEALVIEPVRGYVTYDALALDKILRTTGLHPYFIQVTCRMVVNFCNKERKSYVTLTDLNQVLMEAVEGSTAHVKYLFNDYATGRERDALVVLARATDDVKHAATLAELAQVGKENQLEMDRFELGELFASLAAKKMVRSEGELRGELYAFEFDFVRLWIREHVIVRGGTFRLI